MFGHHINQRSSLTFSRQSHCFHRQGAQGLHGTQSMGSGMLQCSLDTSLNKLTHTNRSPRARTRTRPNNPTAAAPSCNRFTTSQPPSPAFTSVYSHGVRAGRLSATWAHYLLCMSFAFGAVAEERRHASTSCTLLRWRDGSKEGCDVLLRRVVAVYHSSGLGARHGLRGEGENKRNRQDKKI